jgi:hypothetical protein
MDEGLSPPAAVQITPARCHQYGDKNPTVLGHHSKGFFDLKFDDSETIIFFVEMPHAIQA